MSETDSANVLGRIVAAASFADGPPVAAFEAFLTERALDRAEVPELSDLYLAFACVKGSEAARRRLGEVLWQVSLGSSHIPKATIDDARQIVFERLLAPANPKIVTYDGRGPLGGWLRVVLAREALALHKQSSSHVESSSGDWTDVLVDIAAPTESPEVSALKADLWARVRASLKRAAASLESKDRALLRQHLALGMSVDVLAPVHGVHRATVARWIMAAKDAFVARFHSELKTTLGVSGSEMASLYALVQSRLDISLASVFATVRETSADVADQKA